MTPGGSEGTLVDHHGLDLGSATTESVDPRFADLDLLSTREIVTVMNHAEMDVPRAVERALPQISTAIDAISTRMARGGRLIYVGAGTSGRLGVLDASECPPTFSSEPWQVLGIIAGGDRALRHAIEGAEDDASCGRTDILQTAPTEDDSIVGITASGRSPYVLGAITAAREIGAATIGIACNEGSALARLAEFPIEAVVGPEVLTGSTRLKAGSAQKQILNMISTTAMIKLGKSYGNLMVDVQASNQKLKARAQDLVIRITGCDSQTAADALARCEGRVKVAVVSIAHNVGAAQARAILASAGGVLRTALTKGGQE